MKIKTKKLVIAEIILIFSSVLIFRSAWILLDEIFIMNEMSVLIVSFFFGVVGAILCVHYILKSKNDF